MRKFNILITIVIVTFVAGCASSSGRIQYPNWVNRRAPSDEIWGTGGAKLQDGTLSLQIATARARREISNVFGVVTEGMLRTWQLDAGLIDNAQASRVAEVVYTELLSPRYVSGTEVINQQQMPDGTWWVRVSIKKAEAERIIADTVRREAANAALQGMEDALSRMGAQWDRPEVNNRPPRMED